MDEEPRLRDRWSRPKVQVHFPEEEGRTKQSFTEDCDINVIVSRWLKTGIPPEALARGEARYMDFDSVDDYETMQNKIAEARNEFSLLPSEIRKQFDNDVANLIDYLSDPENHEEARKRGLMAALPAEDPPSPPAPEQPPAGPPPAPQEPPPEPSE